MALLAPLSATPAPAGPSQSTVLAFRWASSFPTSTQAWIFVEQENERCGHEAQWAGAWQPVPHTLRSAGQSDQAVQAGHCFSGVPCRGNPSLGACAQLLQLQQVCSTLATPPSSVPVTGGLGPISAPGWHMAQASSSLPGWL